MCVGVGMCGVCLAARVGDPHEQALGPFLESITSRPPGQPAFAYASRLVPGWIATPSGQMWAVLHVNVMRGPNSTCTERRPARLAPMLIRRSGGCGCFVPVSFVSCHPPAPFFLPFLKLAAVRSIEPSPLKPLPVQCVQVNEGGTVWEDGSNRNFKVKKHQTGREQLVSKHALRTLACSSSGSTALPCLFSSRPAFKQPLRPKRRQSSLALCHHGNRAQPSVKGSHARPPLPTNQPTNQPSTCECCCRPGAQNLAWTCAVCGAPLRKWTSSHWS